MQSAAFISSTPAVRVRDLLRVILEPVSVFRKVEDTPAYARALLVLLVLATLIGVATVRTGLIDLEVERETERAIAALEKDQGDSLSRIELSERIEAIAKTSVFNKLVMRAWVCAAAPLQLLVSVLVVASLLYAVVALTGNKPEYHTLVAIGVYASAVDVLAAVLRLGMMLAYRTVNVDTSLGLLIAKPLQGFGVKAVLTAVDPLRIWFWVLVALGAVVTRQLSRRAALVACTMFCLIAIGARLVPMVAGVGGAK
jgi:hypothetical protein